jgi:hypothetical protein
MGSTLFLVAGDLKSICKIEKGKPTDPLLAFLVWRLLGHSNHETSEMLWFLQQTK